MNIVAFLGGCFTGALITFVAMCIAFAAGEKSEKKCTEKLDNSTE